MPLNEYSCECGNLLTIWRVEYDQEKILCPICGRNMNRVWNTVEHRFVGTGFHVNDYAPTVEAGGDDEV